MNLGGLNVATPATPADAKGMLKTAIRADNPTIYLVAGGRGGAAGDVPDGEHVVPLGKAVIHREGSDLTLVAIGSMVQPSLQAAQALGEQGFEVEVVDPRWMVPLDEDSILRSVSKTGKLMIVDEARDRCSAASQIAALVAEKGFDRLRAPIRRVTVPNVAIPYSPPLEQTVIPNAERIAAVAQTFFGKS